MSQDAAGWPDDVYAWWNYPTPTDMKNKSSFLVGKSLQSNNILTDDLTAAVFLDSTKLGSRQKHQNKCGTTEGCGGQEVKQTSCWLSGYLGESLDSNRKCSSSNPASYPE
jgi:hypothetical protein